MQSRQPLSAVAVIMFLAGFLLNSCHQSTSTLKILEGSPTPPGEAAHVVAIAFANGDFVCTGVLISDTLILTAAHCLDGRTPYEKNLKVALGEGSDRHHFEQSELLAIARGKISPNYTGTRTGKSDADIAYLVLEKPILNMTKHIVPPALNFAEVLTIEQQGQKLRLIGYGCRDQNINCTAGTKYQVDVEVNSTTRYIMDVGTRSKGASNGDSGGPAFAIMRDGSQRLMGITSGKGDIGAFYGLVRPNICWISRDSNIEIPGAAQHCYDQTVVGSNEPDVIINACKQPANELQSQTFHVLMKKLNASTCDELLTSLASAENLDLSNAYFIDASILTAAQKLKNLDLTGNPQTSLLPLQSLKSLDTLKLDLTMMEVKQLDSLQNSKPDLKIISSRPESDIFIGIQQSQKIIFDLALESLSSYDFTDASGQTPLHRAIWAKQDANVAKLVERGANIRTVEPLDHQSALHLAVIVNSFSSVKLLVDHKADCYLKNKHSQTPLEIAELYNNGSDMHKYLKAQCVKP